MKTFAKVLIMLVRLFALISIVFGLLIWAGMRVEFLRLHIALGFIITLLLGILAALALARRLVLPGILGLVFAVLLPYLGLKQFPMAFRPDFGLIQTAHVIVALAALGIAEMLHARVARS